MLKSEIAFKGSERRFLRTSEIGKNMDDIWKLCLWCNRTENNYTPPSKSTEFVCSTCTQKLLRISAKDLQDARVEGYGQKRVIGIFLGR